MHPLPAANIRFALESFVTMLVVVDPFGLVPIFASVTGATPPDERPGIRNRAVVIALLVALFFLIAGRLTLEYLGVSVQAFSISGGILLFATALPMLFGQRGGLQAPEQGEESGLGNDIAVFPLAIPLLSGPGTLTTLLVLTSEAHHSTFRYLSVGAGLLIVFAIAWLVLRVGDRIIKLVGEGGVHVITRVMGIVLAALAVQYVLNGATGFWHVLKH